VVTQTGIRFHSKTVILTTGTFLGGVIHLGMQNQSGGRAGDPSTIGLAERLRELPFNVGRLKTGTPPRIDGKTVDFSVMEEQWGDDPRPVMSFMGSPSEHPEQRCCFITRTTEQTHDIIRGGLDRSPMFAGDIEGIGPRYCPSIEDKVHRFADKDSHQIFVEPEGLNTHELYPNGISTSLPFDVQIEAVRTIPGFENAHITRPGYAIEYDFLDPRTCATPWKPSSSATSGLRGRSTAPPATRKPGPRGFWPVSTPPCAPRSATAGTRAGTRPIWACWWTTSSPWALKSPIACSPAARNTG